MIGDIDLAVEIMRSIANENKWPFMQTRLAAKEPQDIMNERIGSYKSKEGIEWKISQKGNDLVLRYKDVHRKKFSSPINLYRMENGHYLLIIEPDTLDLKFSSENGVKRFILSKYGGAKILLEKTD